MTDMNTAIAFQRGWVVSSTEYDDAEIIGKSWKHLVDGMWIYEQPLFKTDAKLYMELFEEMANAELEPALRFENGKYVMCYQKEGAWIIRVIITSNTIGGAICKAYCELNKLEYETSIAQALSELECEE